MSQKGGWWGPRAADKCPDCAELTAEIARLKASNERLCAVALGARRVLEVSETADKYPQEASAVERSRLWNAWGRLLPEDLEP